LDAIVCRGLSKHYGHITALDNLDLAVKEGTIFGFLGPNGAGKTTTLKLLVGLSKPTDGKAWIAGEAVTPHSANLQNSIGYLPEDPSFYSWMTARDYMSFVGQIFRLSSGEIKTRTDDLLELVDLSEAGSRKIGGYSRGMRQRLGIAQALMNKPHVLFLDEPSSALDPIGRVEVLDTLLRLKKEATTIFLSSHILADIERVCDEVGIINKGTLVVQSPIDELRQRFARPVFELEVEGQVADLINKLETLSCVTCVEIDHLESLTRIRVIVDDVPVARNELPKIIVQSDSILLSYQIAQPNLEDVFIQVMKDEKEQ